MLQNGFKDNEYKNIKSHPHLDFPTYLFCEFFTSDLKLCHVSCKEKNNYHISIVESFHLQLMLGEVTLFNFFDFY